jgi:hypothetical protein
MAAMSVLWNFLSAADKAFVQAQANGSPLPTPRTLRCCRPRRRQGAHRFHAKPGRHFFGHGVFSADGKLLHQEHDYRNAEGIIGVRDATDGYRQIGEFSARGWSRMMCSFSRTTAPWSSPMAASKPTPTPVPTNSTFPT